VINLDQLGQGIHDPLKAYTGIEQIIKADQDLEEGEEAPIRLSWKAISPYIPDQSPGVFTVKAVPGTIDPENFPEDAEISHNTNPTAVFSFTVYGPKNDPSCLEYLGKAFDWFKTPRLGPEYLKDTFDVVVVDVSPITPRGTGFLEFDREERSGFDVTFRFSETVKVISETVESAELTNGEGEKTTITKE
jgi:hypothetical protein